MCIGRATYRTRPVNSLLQLHKTIALQMHVFHFPTSPQTTKKDLEAAVHISQHLSCHMQYLSFPSINLMEYYDT